MECKENDTDGDREEGEIFDDDLETISDDSIVVSPTTGKLNSREESLRALSLSSVSDLEVLESSSSSTKNHHYSRRGHARKRRKLHKRYYQESSSGSSSENEETRKTKKLLKDAIRRDTGAIHNKSLSTRLKNMAQKSTLTESTEIIPPNDCDNLQDEVSITLEEKEIEKSPIRTTQGDGDDDLIQLRLEALKTAVINKFQRKKKKIKLDDQVESKTLETNKENSPDNVITQICNLEDPNCAEGISDQNQVVVNPSSPNSAINSEEDVDEDILRAVLLASMAKKMTNKISTPKRKNIAPNSNNMIKKQSKPQVVSQSNINPPKMKPFIISINNPDSDSNDEFNEVEETKSMKVIDKKMELHIDNFLKQTRAEVEAKIESTKSIIYLNTNPQKKQNEEINDLYKHLPKNKQLEYKKLIQKLAERKTKVKRLSNRTSDHKVQKSKAVARTAVNNSGTILSISGSLQRQLKQVQQEVSGRLQKDKYQELSLLMTRLNEANDEQKKHEIRIKHLLNLLKDAREQSAKSQQIFNGLMKEFLKKKEEIDSDTKGVSNPKPLVRTTQKPSVTKVNNVNNTKKLPEPTNPKEKVSDIRNSSVQCKIVLEKCPDNLEDPNDVEFKILPKVEKSAVPKYSSPLDYMESKNIKIHNPMEILCPFEMDGLCRDKDCVYNHCN